MNLKNLLEVSRNLNILYIEDDISRVTTTLLLERIFKNVIVAIDGKDGLNKYMEYYEKTKEYIDIIISDIHMPNMNGLELSRQVLKINDNQIFIITSAYKDSKCIIDLINLGISSFIIKPIQKDIAIKILYKACKEIQNTNIMRANNDKIKKLNNTLKNSNKILENREKDRTETIEHMLYNDTITELKSHASLMKDLEEMDHVTLFLVNIDSFYTINKHYGFENANNLLRQFAQCLKLFNSDNKYSLYRIYADEFVVCKKMKEEDTKGYKKEIISLIDTINEYNFSLEYSHSINLGVTIGVSIGSDLHLMHASTALRHAKKHHKPYMMYEKDIENNYNQSDIIKWSSRLKLAIENDLVLTAYQPIVNERGEILKYEVLMRIAEREGDNLKIISPFHFLEPAQKTKFYNKMMDLLIEKSFINMYNRTEDFSINLSYEDIYNNTLINILKDNILKYPKIGHRLIIEILETESIEDLEIMQHFIKDMRKLGVRFAIDDFGTGHSNFANIIDIRPDYIKIDGSFIKNIHKDRRSYTLVKSIVIAAKELKIKTIAEFVHNEEVFRIVKYLGIDEFQGYHFSEPLLNL